MPGTPPLIFCSEKFPVYRAGSGLYNAGFRCYGEDGAMRMFHGYPTEQLNLVVPSSANCFKINARHKVIVAMEVFIALH
jgi:hypothetical protein